MSRITPLQTADLGSTANGRSGFHCSLAPMPINHPHHCGTDELSSDRSLSSQAETHWSPHVDMPFFTHIPKHLLGTAGVGGGLLVSSTLDSCLCLNLLTCCHTAIPLPVLKSPGFILLTRQLPWSFSAVWLPRERQEEFLPGIPRSSEAQRIQLGA